MQINLPLSWTFAAEYWQKTIPLANKSYLPWAKVPYDIRDYSELVDLLIKDNPTGFILRGCNKELSQEVTKVGGTALSLGESAELAKNQSFKDSVYELIARASKKTYIVEIKSLNEFINAISNLDLKFNTQNSLRNLFKCSFDQFDTTLVARTEDHKTVGLVSTSRIMTDKLHLELMLRDRAAPIGTMEMLVFELTQRETLNLGEVPLLNSLKSNNLREFLISKLILLLNPRYNFEGLSSFKDKFDPNWEPVYWCGWPKITTLDFARVAFSTNSHKLIAALN